MVRISVKRNFFYLRCLRSTSAKSWGGKWSFIAAIANRTSSKECSVVGMFKQRAMEALEKGLSQEYHQGAEATERH